MRWFLPLFLFLFSGCNGSDGSQLQQQPQLQHQIQAPERAFSGWELRMQAVVGDKQNEPILFDARITGESFTLIFPPNGILPGMQIRHTPGQTTLVDPSTARYANIRGRYDFLAAPQARTLPAASHLQETPGAIAARYWLVHPEGFSSLHELEITPGDAAFPPLRDLAAFLRRRLPLDLPETWMDRPVAGWTWREAAGGKTGFSRFQILRANPIRISASETALQIPGYAAVLPADLLPRPAMDARTAQPMVTSLKHSGLLFVNRTPRAILLADQIAEIQMNAEIQLTPLLGGIPVWKGTVRGNHVWTIE